MTHEEATATAQRVALKAEAKKDRAATREAKRLAELRSFKRSDKESLSNLARRFL